MILAEQHKESRAMFIKLKDGSKVEVEPNSTAKDLAIKLNLNGPHQALGACINGITRDLSTPLNQDDEIIFWNFDDKEGKEIFWHTSAHLLAQAVLRLYPNAKPTIGPPIENGFYYDFADLSISDEDFDKIEKEIKNIVKENYASERIVFNGKEEALKNFSHNPYKLELIEGFEEGVFTAYKQGEFFDLCRGPHLSNIGKIKAFKILKTSGAYWRGDSNREMLTRIYAISFPEREQLKHYIIQVEEAKKRDHRVIGPKLDLFSFKEEAPAMPFIHPKGLIIWNALIHFLREKQNAYDYIEIKTPSMLTRDLWERSGHWANYRDNMFTCEIEGRDFAIKPMNCPGCMLYYKGKSHSYRELPLRVAEIGNVHRYEPSGAVSGLFRVRSFHQDDAHIFMRKDQIEEEILNALQFFDLIYNAFELEYKLELSTRPIANTIGSDADWEVATNGLKAALDRSKREYRINEGDGAFYGPKIDFHVKDTLGRTWQCGTIQLDMNLPERFDLEYTANDGSRQRPIMIHRAVFGSIERFFGILIEHFAGKFPLWLSPVHLRILTVADRHEHFAQELKKRFNEAGFICEVDADSESVSKKVRNAQMDQINYILTVGDQEVENGTINLRTRDNVVHGEMAVDALIKRMKEEYTSRALR